MRNIYLEQQMKKMLKTKDEMDDFGDWYYHQRKEDGDFYREKDNDENELQKA